MPTTRRVYFDRRYRRVTTPPAIVYISADPSNYARVVSPVIGDFIHPGFRFVLGETTKCIITANAHFGGNETNKGNEKKKKKGREERRIGWKARGNLYPWIGRGGLESVIRRLHASHMQS